MQSRIEAQKRFWDGQGPSLILIPPAQTELYDTAGYVEKFNNPERMWESEIGRAKAVLNWPTDGIPTVRPNLGVVFIPAMAGQDFQLVDGQMPWPGPPLSRDKIRAIHDIDIARTDIMKLAKDFYSIHHERGEHTAFAYLADTQGVFDIAHILYGDETFIDLADPSQQDWIHELMDICCNLYSRASWHLKSIVGGSIQSMVHGHGTEQGVYFPNAGVRYCEDTATLLSPRMIEETVMPAAMRTIHPFDGAFVHFCGKHQSLYEQFCRSPLVKAIDLGNTELYDLHWLLERCAETSTVYHSRVAEKEDEDWRSYITRIAEAVRDTGARCILRPTVFPETCQECQDMLNLWHDLTA